MEKEKQKSGRFSILIRITAGILAVMMIATVLLYSRSAVTLDTETFEDKESRIAARELARENEYISDSRFEQMAAYASDLLNGRRTYEETERAAQIAVAQSRYDEAVALTEQSVSLYEGDHEGQGRLYLRLGYLYILKNDHEQAMTWLDRGLALFESPEAYITRAQIEMERGDTEAALRDADRGMKAAGDSGALLADLVNIYEEAGQYEVSAEMYTKLIERNGGNEYLLHRAYCLTSLGRMEEASEDRERYEAAGGKELGSADVMLGVGWMRLQDYAKADDCFARATGESFDDQDSLLYYTVLCAYMTENFDRVCMYGDQLIERMRTGGEKTDEPTKKKQLSVSLIKPDPAALYQMNGAGHLAKGEYAAAEERLTVCLEITPDDAFARFLRGTSRMGQEKYAEAIPDFDAAVAAETETERSRFSRGLCRAQTNDREGALEDFDWVVLYGQDEELFTEAGRQILVLNGTIPAKNAGDAENTERTEASGR